MISITDYESIFHFGMDIRVTKFLPYESTDGTVHTFVWKHGLLNETLLPTREILFISDEAKKHLDNVLIFRPKSSSWFKSTKLSKCIGECEKQYLDKKEKYTIWICRECLDKLDL